jgi:N-methylhydantoinase A/oxoprolinase/acetone carboxylase beta subunit
MLGAVVLGNTINKKEFNCTDIGGTTAKCTLIEDGTPK